MRKKMKCLKKSMESILKSSQIKRKKERNEGMKKLTSLKYLILQASSQHTCIMCVCICTKSLEGLKIVGILWLVTYRSDVPSSFLLVSQTFCCSYLSAVQREEKKKNWPKWLRKSRDIFLPSSLYLQVKKKKSHIPYQKKKSMD